MKGITIRFKSTKRTKRIKRTKRTKRTSLKQRGGSTHIPETEYYGTKVGQVDPTDPIDGSISRVSSSFEEPNKIETSAAI
jgi:hypothetical protein